MRWGGTCPRCGQAFGGRADGKTMGRHKTDSYAPFSNVREECGYSGVTVQDAKNRITSLMRRTQKHIVKVSVAAGGVMDDRSAALLADRGLLEETRAMIREALA